MAYSSEEIQAAVERLLGSRVIRSVSAEGIREVDKEFSELSLKVADAFIQHVSSPNYVTMLALDRLNGISRIIVEKIDNLSEKIEITGRVVRPIEDISSLSDATNALFGLESALSARGYSTSTPSTIPSYQQWTSSSLKYIRQIGDSVKEDGQLVDTPNEAKAQIPLLFKEIIEDYERIEELALSIEAGKQDYERLQLPAQVAKTVVSNARKLLEEDKQELQGLSASDRLQKAREKTLNAITAKATIDAYVQQKAQTSITFSGLLTPFSDSNHEAEQAYITGDIPGPYPLISYPVPYGSLPDVRDNNRLSITTEGRTQEIILPTSFLAFLTATGKPQPQPAYDPSVPPPPINPSDPSITYTFYGVGEELGMNAAYCAAKSPARIPGTGSPNGAKYCESFEVDKENQWFFPEPNDKLFIEQIIEGGSTTRYEVNLIDKLPWPAADGRTIFEYPDPGAIPPFTPCQDWSGYKVQLTLQQVIDKVNAVLIAQGSYLRAYASDTGGLEVRCADPVDCVVSRIVGLRIPRVVVATVETNTAAQNPLGFVLGLEMMSRRQSAIQVAQYLNGSSSRITAEVVAFPPHPTLDRMRAWSNMADPAGVILAKYTGFAQISSVGTNITVTSGAYLPTFESYDVAVGDILCLPRQYVKDGSNFITLADEGARYQVTSVSGNTLTASKVSGPTALSATYRAFDVGLSQVLSNVASLQVASIHTTPNDGSYEIASIDPYSPFRVRFGLLLSQNKQIDENLPVEMEVTVGPASLRLLSNDLTTASSIAVSGSMRPLVFSTAMSARGKTRYVRLPENSPKFVETDKFEFTDVDGSYQRTVLNVEDRVLTLNDTVRSEIVWTVGGSAIPKVRALSGPQVAVENKTLELGAWRSTQPTNISTFAADTSAKLNPLLLPTIPAAGRITDAKAALQTLRNKVNSLVGISAVSLTGPLPDTPPTTFYVPPVPAIDDMLEMLKAKGCDRAVDLLLECKFSEFFGMDKDDMSYSGSMQKAARDVARNDLTTSKFGTSNLRRKILSSYQDYDPDYDRLDSDESPSAPDAVAGFDLPSGFDS